MDPELIAVVMVVGDKLYEIRWVENLSCTLQRRVELLREVLASSFHGLPHDGAQHGFGRLRHVLLASVNDVVAFVQVEDSLIREITVYSRYM